MNFAKTALLLAALTALFGVVGYLLGGPTGMMVALAVAIAMNLFTYWNSDRLALAAYDAREVTAQTAPELVRMTHELARRASIPPPRVYVIDSPQPNAFATGRSPENGAVAVTTGLMHALSREELAGVIAHELAHIRNRDTLIMTVAATIAGAISSIAQFGFLFAAHRQDNNGNGPGPIAGLVMAILAPLAAMIIQMAVSRSREYEADRLGAEICGEPVWLASALGRIEQGVHAVVDERAEAHPATAPLFIINPLSGRGMDNLFSTHPSTANRINELQKLARAWGRSWSMGAPAAGGFRSGASANPWARRSGPWG
ncbi:zinc metalloprotease HtpX [Camelimonas abortus]|uniref:Protease HtpX homolog n=1 Tax=Camelimonas abortus TaxID=1017184 RepID=A0ABV7LE77_9HYPH